MSTPFSPYREPLRTTLARTFTIAAGIGLVFSIRAQDMSRWPRATMLALWPSLGGHLVELLFLNVLRPRLPASRIVHILLRIATWFAGGVVLFFAMKLTAMLLGYAGMLPPHACWIGGAAFIAIELVVHLLMQLRGAPNFYNGRG